MMLENRIAVIYGAGGHVGGAVAKALAADGARVFLTGRTRDKVERVAAEIRASGGVAETAQVDALDGKAVADHLGDVVSRTGRLDISFNAISICGDLQGTPLHKMTLDDFITPVRVGASAHFLTATAAARHMIEARRGVILTLSSSAPGLSGRDRMFHKPGGFGVACAAIEEFSRTLAGELGPLGVRVVCLRSDAISEVWPIEHEAAWAPAKAYMDASTVLGRLPKLTELASAAAFAASDRASAMTGTLLNLTCGSIMDAN